MGGVFGWFGSPRLGVKELSNFWFIDSGFPVFSIATFFGVGDFLLRGLLSCDILLGGDGVLKGGGFRAALSMGDLIADLSNVTLQVGGGDLNLIEKDTRNCRLENEKV